MIQNALRCDAKPTTIAPRSLHSRAHRNEAAPIAHSSKPFASVADSRSGRTDRNSRR
ncbi:hypothetical protein RP20_CCG024856 [Aedes albopictus]|nr:hypothetical protein RP20_CCG024856 [Aedes albopictus]